MKKIFAFLFLLMFLSVACEKKERVPVDVYKARESLEILGYEFTEIDLAKAVKEGKTDIVKLFFDAGMSPDSTVQHKIYQIPLIYFVIDKGNELLLQVFIQAKADLNIQVAGTTPLIKAVEKGNASMISMMIKAGADVNTAGSDGLTPLLSAIDKNNTGVVWTLLQQGADVNLQDYNGFSPLMFAVSSGNSEVVRELIKRGANVNQTSKNGTKIKSFLGKNRKEIELLLIEAGAKLD
ncbi:ankyrin repeat domain-containing protein [bacterium]|nr:ankyrin repeat domain-containing protein [bacterium]